MVTPLPLRVTRPVLVDGVVRLRKVLRGSPGAAIVLRVAPVLDFFVATRRALLGVIEAIS